MIGTKQEFEANLRVKGIRDSAIRFNRWRRGKAVSKQQLLNEPKDGDDVEKQSRVNNIIVKETVRANAAYFAVGSDFCWTNNR